MKIENIVTQSTFELASLPTPLPPFLKFTCLSLHKIHALYKRVRKVHIYTNPHNFAYLAAGHGLHYVMRQSTLVKISAIALLIITRLLNAAHTLEQIQNSWETMKNGIYNRYPTPIKISWNQKHGFFSLSTIIRIKTSVRATCIRIHIIVTNLLKTGKYTILLSFHLMDVIEAFTLTPEAQNESINLFFINSATCLDKLTEHKGLLLNSLEINKSTIEKVLTHLGSHLTTKELINAVKSNLERTEGVHQHSETVRRQVGEFVTECGKKYAYELLHGVGLSHLIPKQHLPSVTPPWEHPQRIGLQTRFFPQKRQQKHAQISYKHR